MTLSLGDISISRVVEMEGPLMEPQMLLPDATAEGMAKHKHWLAPQFVAENGNLIISIQTYVVKTRHHTVLVDTCVGNHKPHSVSGLEHAGWPVSTGPWRARGKP